MTELAAFEKKPFETIGYACKLNVSFIKSSLPESHGWNTSLPLYSLDFCCLGERLQLQDNLAFGGDT